jgi:hypothetical protein
MKVIIEFSEDDNDTKQDVDRAIKGDKLVYAVFNARETALKELKHTDMSEAYEQGFERCLQILNSKIEEEDLEYLFK